MTLIQILLAILIVLILVIVVGLATGILTFRQVLQIIFNIKLEKEEINCQGFYERKKVLMTAREKGFFDNLRAVVGGKYDIYPQVNLDKILSVKRGLTKSEWRTAINKINRKSVDFLIVNVDYQSPVAAIELDDYFHERPDRMDRDKFVEGAFVSAGIPLIRYGAGDNYSIEDLRVTFDKYLTRE